MTVHHNFVSGKVDGSDATLVQPSAWNAAHTVDPGTITLAMLANVSATQRVLGRNTAGAGVPEEVTASQLFDWVSNTNGVLLTRTGGSWAALANVSTNNGDLLFADNLTPVAPTGTNLKVSGGDNAGRAMLSGLAAGGARMLAQPFLGQQHIARWVCAAGVTTPAVEGVGNATATGTGTSRPLASTNLFTGVRRVGYVSAAGAGSVCGVRNTNNCLWRGNVAGAGGFHFVMRFGISDASIVTTGRTFAGITSLLTAPTDVDPSTLTNLIGVGCDANDTVLQLYAAGAAAQTRTAFSASFPANTVSTDLYEIALYCPPNGSNVMYQLTRLNTGDVASGTISNAANLPSNTTFLNPQLWRTNGATATAVAIDLAGMYFETDY